MNAGHLVSLSTQAPVLIANIVDICIKALAIVSLLLTAASEILESAGA